MIQIFQKGLRKKGFTLVELLIVIAVIGILFIVLVSKVEFATDRARETGVKTDFRSYQVALQTVGLEQQEFTSDYYKLVNQLNENLDPKLELSNGVDGLFTDAEDPWSSTYRLSYRKVEGQNRGSVAIVSSGPDLVFETADDITMTATYLLTDYGGQVVFGDTLTTDEGVVHRVGIAGGLYQTGSDYTVLLKSWHQLIEDGDIIVFENETPVNKGLIQMQVVNKALSGDLAVQDGIQMTNTAFQNCTGLINVYMPDSVIKSGNSFTNCSSVQSVRMSNGLTVPTSTVKNCPNIVEFVFPANCLAPVSTCEGCTGLKRVILPSSLESIGKNLFKNCTSLERVTYHGTIAQFKSIPKGADWNLNCPDFIIECADGSIRNSQLG